MPEFYLVPKRLARRSPRLARFSRRAEAAIFRALFGLVRRLPLQTALRLTGSVFYTLGRFSNKRQKAMANLAVAFPERSQSWRERTAREIFRHLGYATVELIKLDQIRAQEDERVEYVLEPGAQRHMESGAATLFLTAHVGAWQVAPLITHKYGFTINAIYAPDSNPAIDAIMQELRSSVWERLIAADAGPRPLLRELNAGHSIIMAMDTRPDTGKLLPFFEREALSNTSAVGLALRTGAAVVAARCERLPGARFRITMYDPITSPDPEAPLKEQATAITLRIHRYFEDWIREYPEQWICLKRRWPKAHKL